MRPAGKTADEVDRSLFALARFAIFLAIVSDGWMRCEAGSIYAAAGLCMASS
jgi:hypothetical protein